MSVETGAPRGDGQSLTSEAEAKQTRTDAEIWLLKIHRQRDLEDDWREDAREAIKVYEAEADAVSFNIFSGPEPSNLVAQQPKPACFNPCRALSS